MPPLRSRTTTFGRNMAGARALWRATGMTDSDFGKPIVAVANSFTQFVPGHVHLRDVGRIVAEAIPQAGGVGRECSPSASDAGIATARGGWLCGRPSRGPRAAPAGGGPERWPALGASAPLSPLRAQLLAARAVRFAAWPSCVPLWRCLWRLLS